MLMCITWYLLSSTLAATHQEQFAGEDRCTAIVVALKASVGGPMTTHTMDCSDCDFRLSKVPARDWPVGSMRPLYLLRSTYPAQISEDRGDTWKIANLEGSTEQVKTWSTDETFTQVTGYIPQVQLCGMLLEHVLFDCLNRLPTPMHYLKVYMQ